jgi:oxygen-independent coproporphyrinogen-3 oxidase
MGAGIYLSVPFCRQKCTYCNFASSVQPFSELPRYLQALETEIARHGEFWQQAGVSDSNEVSADTVYLGGGTPSLLGGEQLRSLLHTVRATFPLEGESEITLEASPENVTPNAASIWASCGVNRVSLGVQSMVSKELRAVGRMHDAETVAGAVAVLRRSGIENISVDLIAGLPHQTKESWETTLLGVLALQLPHVSAYMLEVDEDSRLGSELLHQGTRYGAAAVPSEEQVAEFYRAACEQLEQSGYQHYEISNFALPGRESRHNDKYWTSIPYFGFGVDAHSYNGEHRWANADSLAEYLQRIESDRSAIVDCKRLGMAERLEERFFLGLRRRQGVRISELSREFGPAALHRVEPRIAEFCEAGWIERGKDILRLSDTGVLFSNEVFAGLLG